MRRLVPNQHSNPRRGVVAVNVAILLIPIMAFLALALDCGYLLKMRTELQSAADTAALAAVRELVPSATGQQDLDKVRETARTYAQGNLTGTAFRVNDADIQIGRYDPSSIYTRVNLLDDGQYDTVRVTVRRDRTTNSAVRLYFAGIIGIPTCEVTATATAILPRASVLKVGDGVLPFAVTTAIWDNCDIGDQFKTYNGKIVDPFGKTISGNWGTVDIGKTNNSTKDLSDQILKGLRQSDLDALYASGRIANNSYIDTTVPISVQADPGLSSGLKSAVAAIKGQVRYMPIYESVGGGNGNNAKYEIVRWGLVRVVGSTFSGAKNTFITFEKTSAYDGKLTPHSDLSDTSTTISGAFSRPTLVE